MQSNFMDVFYKMHPAQCLDRYLAIFEHAYPVCDPMWHDANYGQIVSAHSLAEMHDPYITSLIHEFQESFNCLPDDSGHYIMNMEYRLYENDLDDIVDTTYVDQECSSKKRKAIGQCACRKCGKKYVSIDGVRKHYKKAHGVPPSRGHVDEYCVRSE